jgi:diaminopimelate decarboxylase
MSPASPSANTSLVPLTFSADDPKGPSIGGVTIAELVKTYGTPLYVLDEATLRSMARAYTGALKTHYPGEALPLFASKANMNMGLCKLVEQEGLGLDVVSGGELFTAIQAGFPMQKVFFNGNNKTTEELELALHHRVGRITVDNFYELELLHQVASRKGVTADILLRITPGIECHTHDYIKTGQNDSKFGFDLSGLARAIDLITTEYANSLSLKGLHAHIGSQIFEIKPYEDLAEIFLNIYYNIREQYNGLVLTDLNIGGGMGVAYTQGDDPPDVPAALERIVTRISQYAEKLDYPLPRLVLEPGRSLVATAGVTLYTVGSIKEVPGVRKYVAVDGGMGDNIRPALYQAEYTAVVVNKLDQINNPDPEPVAIAGKYCESGDILIRNFVGPRLEPGDTLMVLATGAYNYTMASNYNRIPRPAMVLVNNGQSHLLVRRETYESLLQNDLVPQHLQNAPQPVA